MAKKRSEIIIDLIKSNINVLQAMQSLDLMLEDLENDEIRTWVNNELHGYTNKDIIPPYRKINTSLDGNVQVGYAIFQNINIPISDKKAQEALFTQTIYDPISTIIQLAKAEEENENHSLCSPVDLGVVNHYKEINGDVIKAQKNFGIYAYTNILAKIKDKLLNIFKELEKNYNNLDELYIDFSNKEQQEQVLNKLQSIIYNDNSIHMGNNNDIKNSTLGENNEN